MIMNLKKYTLGLVLAGAISTDAATLSFTLTGNTATNALIPANGLITITGATVTAPSTTNALIYVYDAPLTNFNGIANALSYTNAPYTNTVSYLTNMIFNYTNFYGQITLLTNVVQVDNTNNLVDGSTNYYPIRIQAGALAGSSYNIANQNYYFQNGVLLTNPSASTVTFTFTYH